MTRTEANGLVGKNLRDARGLTFRVTTVTFAPANRRDSSRRWLVQGHVVGSKELVYMHFPYTAPNGR